jgi:hypothetical protein
MRYRLRTLLILLAVGPPMLAWTWFAWLEFCERQQSQGYSFEWGGVIVLDDLEPIPIEDFPQSTDETQLP